jgi:hypothetical protein
VGRSAEVSVVLCADHSRSTCLSQSRMVFMKTSG